MYIFLFIQAGLVASQVYTANTLTGSVTINLPGDDSIKADKAVRSRFG